MITEKIRLASGQEEIRGKIYYFELWNNDLISLSKIFTSEGKEIEFTRNQKNHLKNIEAALIINGVITECN